MAEIDSAAAEIFSPQRLRLARQRRGLFAQELAARIGASTRSVSLWENGKIRPTEKHIDALSDILKFPREFFFGDAPPTLGGAAFRSLARMTSQQRLMAISAGCQAVALDEWIDGQFKRPAPHVPDLRDATPEGAADAIRAAWGLGYHPVPNLVHLLEANGVRVYSLVHDGSEVDAFSDWSGATPFVFLNTTKTPERSRMDAAHELGHLVLHAHASVRPDKADEEQAQEFAAAFLMPHAAFVSSSPRIISLGSIIEAKQKWGVSAWAYVYRLHTTGRLSSWQYRSLCIQLNTQFRKTEPGPARPRETSQVLAKVLAPTSGIMSTRKEAAKYLRVHLRDLDELTFGLALTPVMGGQKTISPSIQSAQGDSLPKIQLMK